MGTVESEEGKITIWKTVRRKEDLKVEKGESSMSKYNHVHRMGALGGRTI
jgi:hypothetical protein